MSLPELLPLDTPTPVAPPLVSLRDVHLSFGITPVLSGIDLDVQRGQAVSIIGPSGSGKSTLLRCISGLLRPQRGSITVDGIRVDQLATEEDTIALRKRIGFVFQQYNLFPHLSVLDNLIAAPVRVLQGVLQIGDQVIGVVQDDMQAQHAASLIPLSVVCQS